MLMVETLAKDNDPTKSYQPPTSIPPPGEHQGAVGVGKRKKKKADDDESDDDERGSVVSVTSSRSSRSSRSSGRSRAQAQTSAAGPSAAKRRRLDPEAPRPPVNHLPGKNLAYHQKEALANLACHPFSVLQCKKTPLSSEELIAKDKKGKKKAKLVNCCAQPTEHKVPDIVVCRVENEEWAGKFNRKGSRFQAPVLVLEIDSASEGRVKDREARYQLLIPILQGLAFQSVVFGASLNRRRVRFMRVWRDQDSISVRYKDAKLYLGDQPGEFPPGWATTMTIRDTDIRRPSKGPHATQPAPGPTEVGYRLRTVCLEMMRIFADTLHDNEYVMHQMHFVGRMHGVNKFFDGTHGAAKQPKYGPMKPLYNSSVNDEEYVDCQQLRLAADTDFGPNKDEDEDDDDEDEGDDTPVWEYSHKGAPVIGGPKPTEKAQSICCLQVDRKKAETITACFHVSGLIDLQGLVLRQIALDTWPIHWPVEITGIENKTTLRDRRNYIHAQTWAPSRY